VSVKEGSSFDFEKLLEYLKASRGFDFGAYKRSTLQRRVQKRMQIVGVDAYTEYLDFLEVHQDEFQHLFNTILINVTSFFRDQDAWEYISKTVVPKVLENRGPETPVRIWVAGCASGEEAYSIAMVLAEALGIGPFRERVKIYATDLDEDALTSCRNANYTERDIQAVPPELVEKYFERTGERYVFDRELRRSVIFGRHDLIQDAPISRVDLLQCRNTLMYFNAEAQERILSRFHFALNDDGFLFLGKAETLLTHQNLFTPVDLSNRVFSRVNKTRLRDRLQMLIGAKGLESLKIDSNAGQKLRDAAIEKAATAQIAVDLAGRLAIVNERARSLFSLGTQDVGRPFQDVDISYRPVELRSGIEQSMLQRRPVTHKDVVWTTPTGDAVVLDITIVPVDGDGGERVGTTIVFEDVTDFKRLQEELLNFNQELETAYEEVQSTNEELQTTNEELQSTVEELETTNEELQSSNEESETMNEELQSANEELETINEELRIRSQELNRVNSFLESVLSGLRDGVIVIDGNLQVLAWNPRSEDLWGLRSDETVGKHLLNLDIGLPLEKLRPPIRACLVDQSVHELTVEAINRRGRAMSCQLTFTPLRGPTDDQSGVIILAVCTPN
jgi:two-component system CheB/CheR fusion protein